LQNSFLGFEILKLFISAGDPSGDFHAAKLIRELKKLSNDIEFIGIGGSQMQKEGFKSIVPIEDISVVGFWEVAKKYSFFKNLLDKSYNIIKNEKVDAFIPIDYPGFNLRLANKVKKSNIKVIYYIAPQLWAWGKNRAKGLKDSVDTLLTVFEFEKEFFEKYDIKTNFVGHPLLDEPIFSLPIKELKDRKDKICLMPGSRIQEVKRHENLFTETIKLISKVYKNYEISIAKAPSISYSNYHNYQSVNSKVLIEDNAREIMLDSKFGVIKTGTSNLEAGLLGLPFNMIYKTSSLSYIISKKLINIDSISLVNILLKKNLIKEFIQSEATPQNIFNDIKFVIENKDTYNDYLENFYNLREILGNSGASERAAKAIINEIEQI